MRVAALLIGLFAASPALAQNSQVKKATAAFAQFQKGDSEALQAAQAAIDKAAVHKKTGESPDTWGLRAQIYTELTLAEGVPSVESMESVVSTWEGAIERGFALESAAPDLAKLVSATNLVLRDDLESKRIDEAWARVEAAMRARTLLKKTGWSDERVEPQLVELSILTAVRASKVDEAQAWFAEWKAMDRFEPSVAVQVAKAIAEGDKDAAIAFLDPLLKERPIDAAMLTEAVAILVAAKKTDQAVQRVEQAAAHEDASSSAVQLMLGHLYLELGEDGPARAAYEAALEQNPQAAEAWQPLAGLLVAEAKALKEKIDSGELRRAQRNEADDQRTANLESAAALLEKAREAAPEPDKAVLTALIEVYDALGRDDDEAKATEALEKLK